MPNEVTPGESTWGPWLAAVLGLVWVAALVLLSLHLVRRRTGWYARNVSKRIPGPGTILAMDGFIFILVCLFVFLVVRSFSPLPVSWLFRIGFVSGVFAVMCIVVVIREDLSLRRSALEAPDEKAGSSPSRLRETKARRKSRTKDT